MAALQVEKVAHRNIPRARARMQVSQLYLRETGTANIPRTRARMQAPPEAGERERRGSPGGP